jgi:hypothetical protein
MVALVKKQFNIERSLYELQILSVSFFDKTRIDLLLTHSPLQNQEALPANLLTIVDL